MYFLYFYFNNTTTEKITIFLWRPKDDFHNRDEPAKESKYMLGYLENHSTEFFFIECQVYFIGGSLHARLNSHYKAWSYKKKKRKNIKAYRKYL